MKHINESIIGRKGVVSIPRLKNHDIVKLDNNHYYMVVLDEYEMKLTKMPFYKSGITEGILLRYETFSRTWSWQPLNEYNRDLKINPKFKSIISLDICEVYRSLSAITTKYNDHFHMWCDEENMKEKITKGYGDYKLLWKR
jgi:hypothetical protein